MNRTKDGEQNLANAILKIRQDSKLSQEQFAEMIGVTRQAVSRWEMGISVPNINTLVLISEKFGVSVDTMLKGPDHFGEKRETVRIVWKNRHYGFVLLTIGILGLMTLPFLAEWIRIRNMEVSHSAYTYSYHYLFEYPLSVILVLALLLLCIGIYFIFKRKKRRFDDNENKKE